MKDLLAKADEREKTYRVIGRAHYIAADRYTALHRWLGIPVIVITAAVGTTIFGTLNENPDPVLRIAAGLIALAGTVLSSLQTSLGFAQTAEKHKSAGEAYRVIRRRYEMFKLRHVDAAASERASALATFEELDAALAKLPQEFPSLPDRCYERALAENKPNTAERLLNAATAASRS